MVTRFKKDDYYISTDKSKLNYEMIHRFLTNSYWAKNVTFDVVRKSIKNSFCFGVYKDSKQIGFARVVTDHSTFAYLMDVFILEEYRGQGIGKWLMQTILSHNELQNLRTWMLATKDAHSLYEKFGFQPLSNPEKLMELRNKQNN